MTIQIHTDKNITLQPSQSDDIHERIQDSLERFGDWITRVEVQLSDESSAAKTTEGDKRCLIEARPAGLKPVSVSHNGSNVEQAFSGCVKKLVKVLGDMRGKLDTSKGATSFAGEEQV